MKNIFKIFQYAREIEIIKGEIHEDFLNNEFERWITNYRRSRGLSFELLEGCENTSTGVFISAATKAGLCLYVSRRLEKSPELLKPTGGSGSLLRVTYGSTAAKTSYLCAVPHSPWEVNLAMIELLLARGADPNERVAERETTIWHEFLCMGSTSTGHDLSRYLVRAAELFISYGADCNRKMEIDASKRTPLAILRESLVPEHYRRIEALVVEHQAASAPEIKSPSLEIGGREQVIEADAPSVPGMDILPLQAEGKSQVKKSTGFCRCVVL